MTQNNTPDGGQHSGGGQQGERIEGSLTDGGSLPGNRNTDEDRSFGAGKDGMHEGGGTSGSTGASKAGSSGGGDAHLGTGGMGGTAGGDQQTDVPANGARGAVEPK